MISAISFNDTQEFINFNKAVIYENYFFFYPSIMAMHSPEVNEVYQLYNLKDGDGSNAYCMWFYGCYTIHSTKLNEAIIDYLNNNIDLSRYKSSFAFIGQKDLILNLLERQKINYVIFKDRIIYECLKTNVESTLLGELEVATVDDVEILSEMSYQYSLDEYKERAIRDLAYMTKIVESGINSKNIYKLIYQSQIVSMAQVISETNGSPMIGQLYTKLEFRGQGFATSILQQLTNILLSKGHSRCGLVADRNNLPSNKVFLKVGYLPIYEQITAIKKD